ncbi:MAG: S8 family serine peptidase [Planctomycetes bacterium]|nr:S8 family serine peptidase [Planctomycetota bacterium]
MPRFPAVLLLAGAILGAASSGLAAGELDPILAYRLNQAGPGEPVPAFVLLSEQVDLEAMVAWLDRMQATRAFRHEQVVRALQARAAASQPAVRALLERLRHEGKVARYESFWIFNGFFVEADRDAFRRLAWREDVGRIYYAGEENSVDLIQPVSVEPSLDFNPLDAPESGLIECKADFLWNLGFTGKGRIVANIDTGVDGNHNALKARWRGLVAGVPAQAAWYDPVKSTSFPAGRSSHGTHTMGTICGNDGGSNQIGMAPGAWWIASNPIDASGTRAQKNVWYNQAIQWCADPDGNPATVGDVPDVCSNSWGVRDPSNGVPPCSPIFNASIDAAEAATVVFVFAAGNEGTTGPRVPADRIASDTNTFSVGSLDVGSLALSSFSSRGPSPCDSKTVKPEVCARGSSVRSSVPNNSYSTLSGTSMATPHVAGAVALLRDVWPEVTVERVKRILMETADDLGTAGEDNLYGWGRINCEKAYQKLIAERPVVSVRCMGTRQQWKMGETFYAHASITNHSAAPAAVRLELQFYFQDAPTSLILLLPTDLTLPGGLSNEASPLVIRLPIPKGLPAGVLDPSLWSFRGTVRKAGGGAVLNQSDYRFTVTP